MHTIPQPSINRTVRKLDNGYLEKLFEAVLELEVSCIHFCRRHYLSNHLLKLAVLDDLERFRV